MTFSDLKNSAEFGKHNRKRSKNILRLVMRFPFVENKVEVKPDKEYL